MESSRKLTGLRRTEGAKAGASPSGETGSLPRALPGVAIGAAVMVTVWVAEGLATGLDPLALHRHSVAIWVIDALPIVLGLALAGVQLPRSAPVTSSIVPPPPMPDVVPTPRDPTPPGVSRYASPLPATRTATPMPVVRHATPSAVSRDATPPPVPRRLVEGGTVSDAVHIPKGDGRTILVVDGSAEGPTVAAWLTERDYRVVHVGDAASGSLAREAEDPEMAVVDGNLVGAQALIGELGRHHVPVVVLGGSTLSLPARSARTIRLPTAQRLGEALTELSLKG